MIAAALAAPVPARAAVTLRGLHLDDHPRSAWFDRYSEQRQGPEQIEKFTRSVKVGDGAMLDLSHLSGDVRVTGGNGSEIKIEATKRVRHRDADEAKRLLEALRIDVNNFNNRVEVRTIYPRRTATRGNSISANVDYVIEVPPGAAVSLKSVSGDIAVSNVRGEVRLEAVSGNVSITNTPNVALAKTVSGDVIARDIGTQTALVLSTVSGTVIGTGLKVRSLEAGSVSGNVRLTGSQIDRVEAARCPATSSSTRRSRKAAATNSPRTRETSASCSPAIPGSSSTPTRSAAASDPTCRLLCAASDAPSANAAAAPARFGAPTAMPAPSCRSAATADRSLLPKSSSQLHSRRWPERGKLMYMQEFAAWKAGTLGIISAGRLT